MKVVFFSPRLYILFTGTYIDKKCPFTGTVSVRGRILAGTCHSAKMNRTIIVRRNYLHWVKKYQRQGLALFLFSTLVLVLLPFLLVPLNKMPPTWFPPPCTKWYFLSCWLSFRYEKRHSNIPAHISPCFRIREGDHVTIGQCRSAPVIIPLYLIQLIFFGSGQKSLQNHYICTSVLCIAGHCPRQWGSMCWRSSQQDLLVVQRRLLQQCKKLASLMMWWCRNLIDL